MYSRTAFFLAKTLTTTPVEVAQVTLFAVMTYFMFGFQAVAHKFIIYWVTLIMFTLCSETLGYMAAIVTPDSKVGVAMLSILLVLLMSFSGYLVSVGVGGSRKALARRYPACLRAAAGEELPLLLMPFSGYV